MLQTKNISLLDNQALSDLGRALSSSLRLEILSALNENSLSITELSKLLHQPMSSTTTNVDVLEEAGLISTKLYYTKTGKVRLCSRTCDAVFINLHNDTSHLEKTMNINVPIGSFVSYEIAAPCGMATNEHTVGKDDDTDNFFSPERFEAKLIWFNCGYLEYRVSKSKLPTKLQELEISFEACSEAPFYRNNWKSDITVWLNDVEIGTWTCPGDFGGRKGMLNPPWWADNMTQFGTLTSWTIKKSGSYLNHELINTKSFADYKIGESPYLSFKIGVKPDAYYKGGINLFGNTFGDYQQDVTVKAKW